MSHGTIELTDIEKRCGVTPGQVEAMRSQALFIESGKALVFPEFTSAALCSATARYAFGEPAGFAGLNRFGQPVYRREPEIEARL